MHSHFLTFSFFFPASVFCCDLNVSFYKCWRQPRMSECLQHFAKFLQRQVTETASVWSRRPVARWELQPSCLGLSAAARLITPSGHIRLPPHRSTKVICGENEHLEPVSGTLPQNDVFSRCFRKLVKKKRVATRRWRRFSGDFLLDV